MKVEGLFILHQLFFIASQIVSLIGYLFKYLYSSIATFIQIYAKVLRNFFLPPIKLLSSHFSFETSYCLLKNQDRQNIETLKKKALP